jgi:EipB-like
MKHHMTAYMTRYRSWVFALLLLIAPTPGFAQVKPHRAEYILRLGTAANAPRIGTAVQDITLDCKNWHIKREVLSEIAFTPSLKVSFASKLEGEESIDGKAFHYRSVEAQNGPERATEGTVRSADGELRAELSAPDGATHVVLPPLTLMPVAAINFLIGRLADGATSFRKPVFGAEATGQAYTLEVDGLAPQSIRPPPPAMKPVTIAAQKFWSISVTGKRAADQAQKPLFSLRAKMFESGVLDRLTIDAGVATVTADLETIVMHEKPGCSQ